MQSLLPLLATLALLPTPLHASEVTAAREGQQVVVRSGKNEILRYQAEAGGLPRPELPEAYLRGGYIQSIHTPSGRRVTDDFPADHPHHHGVWSPWTKTIFEGRQPDFWNMGAKTGTVEFVALDTIWQKAGKAGFTARHRFVDLSAGSPKVALWETWDIAVSVADGRHVIDFTSTQSCATDSPLILPEYHYGGFGFRGHGDWSRPGHCRYLSASGKNDRLELNTSREKWCWIGGPVDGETVGVAILCHPANDRFPQPVRAHPEHPFFCFAPQQLGEMQIAPGKNYVSRYRLVVADGELEAGQLDAAWEEFAGS
jgi:hypothetical protein